MTDLVVESFVLTAWLSDLFQITTQSKWFASNVGGRWGTLSNRWMRSMTRCQLRQPAQRPQKILRNLKKNRERLRSCNKSNCVVEDFFFFWIFLDFYFLGYFLVEFQKKCWRIYYPERCKNEVKKNILWVDLNKHANNKKKLIPSNQILQKFFWDYF